MPELGKIGKEHSSRSAHMYRNVRQEECGFYGCGDAARCGYALASLSPVLESVMRVSYLVRVGGAVEGDNLPVKSACVVEPYIGERYKQSFPNSLLYQGTLASAPHER